MRKAACEIRWHPGAEGSVSLTATGQTKGRENDPRQALFTAYFGKTQAAAGPLNTASSLWALLKLTSFMN